MARDANYYKIQEAPDLLGNVNPDDALRYSLATTGFPQAVGNANSLIERSKTHPYNLPDADIKQGIIDKYSEAGVTPHTYESPSVSSALLGGAYPAGINQAFDIVSSTKSKEGKPAGNNDAINASNTPVEGLIQASSDGFINGSDRNRFRRLGESASRSVTKNMKNLTSGYLPQNKAATDNSPFINPSNTPVEGLSELNRGKDFSELVPSVRRGIEAGARDFADSVSDLIAPVIKKPGSTSEMDVMLSGAAQTHPAAMSYLQSNADMFENDNESDNRPGDQILDNTFNEIDQRLLEKDVSDYLRSRNDGETPIPDNISADGLLYLMTHDYLFSKDFNKIPSVIRAVNEQSFNRATGGMLEDASSTIYGVKERMSQDDVIDALKSRAEQERDDLDQTSREIMANSFMENPDAYFSNRDVYDEYMRRMLGDEYLTSVDLNDATRVGISSDFGDYILGLTSQGKSSEAVNAVYEANFAKEDLAAAANPDIERGRDFGEFVNSEHMIDDGSPENREAILMTGEQYLKYIEQYGMRGRPVYQIDPDALYSKQDEMDYFGFTPYIKSDQALREFHLRGDSAFLNNAVSNFQQLRTYLTDPKIRYGDQEFSKKDFLLNTNVWAKNELPKYGDRNYWLEEKPAGNEYAVPIALRLYGHEDVPLGRGSSNMVSDVNDDGSINIYYVDEYGNESYVDTYASEQDYLDNIVRVDVDDENQAEYWIDINPVQLNDGTIISPHEAVDIISDINRYTDNGPLGFAQSAPDISNFPAYFTDLVTGSAALFTWPTSALQAGSNMLSYTQGLNPGKDNIYGTYSLISENPTLGDAATRVVSAAMLPLTERLWGPLGGTILPNSRKLGKAFGLDRLKNAKPEAAKGPLRRWAKGTIGEGMEEIPGNIVENTQSSGLAGWYGGYIDIYGNHTDDINKAARDSYGNPIIDTSSDFQSRLQRFILDAPEAFLGGALLGGVLGLGEVPKYTRERQMYQDYPWLFNDPDNEYEYNYLPWKKRDQIPISEDEIRPLVTRG